VAGSNGANSESGAISRIDIGAISDNGAICSGIISDSGANSRSDSGVI
jgi:hypothetical protein